MTTDPGALPTGRATGSRRALRSVGWSLLAVGVAALFVHAWIDTEVSISSLVNGYHGISDILSRSVPPSSNVLTDSIYASIVSFDTALLGTAWAVLISLILAPLAARNTTPNRVVYELARMLLAVTRSIPDLIFALIFVTAVGLGPFAGVLALAVHSVGVMGKLFAEAIEDMEQGPIEALRVSGANRLQIFLHGVLPGVAPTFTGLCLYRFDVNFRSSLTLGFVGAGGIGFLIFNSMELFQYQEVFTELAVVLVFVLVIERVSSLLRARII